MLIHWISFVAKYVRYDTVLEWFGDCHQDNEAEMKQPDVGKRKILGSDATAR